MSPALGIAIMMNNYFHDVATALLLGSAVATWGLLRHIGDSPTEESLALARRMYKHMTRLAWFALGWIVVGGIPRTIFYEQFEWSHFAGKNQIPALAVKHVLAFAFVAGGIWLWRKVRRQIEATGR